MSDALQASDDALPTGGQILRNAMAPEKVVSIEQDMGGHFFEPAEFPWLEELGGFLFKKRVHPMNIFYTDRTLQVFECLKCSTIVITGVISEKPFFLGFFTCPIFIPSDLKYMDRTKYHDELRRYRTPEKHER
jgi:hypothetical protein